MKLWRPVTKREPCPVCLHADWCAVSSDGRVARCMRVVDGPDVIAREDSSGTPYGLRFLDESFNPDPTRYRPDPDPPRAPDPVLHRVYSALLQALPLSVAHRAHLRGRGLSDDAIDLAGYRSLPKEDAERRRAMGRLRALLEGEIPPDVPGLTGGKLAGYSGIVIPVREPGGTVRALKIRADDPHAPRYSWSSSTRDDGPSPGVPCHVPVIQVPTGSTRVIRVTEGPLKADIATALSGVLTIGLAGCTTVRQALPHLRALKAEVVSLAWDADARENHHVAASLRAAVELFRGEGFCVQVETWDASAGKGIDDALFAGCAPTVHAGERVDRVVGEACESAAKVRELKEAAERAKKAGEKGEKAPDHAPVAPAANPPPGRWFDRGDSVELASALIRDLSASAPDAGDLAVIYDRSTFWVYDPSRGVYVEHDLAAMCRRVSAYAGSPTGPKSKPLALSDGAVKGAVKAASWSVSKPGYLDGGPCGIAFADRFVTARDGEVVTLPLSHEHRAIHALPFPYEMDAPCHKWSAMLREVFRRVDEHGQSDEGDTEACISLLGEWTGTTLVGEATSRAVSLVLVGAGNDGKSSVLNVIRSLFPPSAVCAVSPQDWGRGFLLAVLAGKRINVVSELPEREIIDSERFKAVVGGDPLTAERKNQDPFDLECEAGHLFSCNALPPTRDQSDGFWRRFAVIPCDRRFQAHEVVRDLWREIVAEELAGIAAWAIEGAARAQRNRALTSPTSSASAKADWQHDSDAVRQFVAEACVALELGAPSSVESGIGDLYEAFRRWCAATGHTVMARDKLARRLKGLGLEHRTKVARLYRLRVSEQWARAHGLTLPFAGGYGAPN